eukprot:196156_1
MGNETSAAKEYSWYAKDRKRLSLLITPKDRVIVATYESLKDATLSEIDNSISMGYDSKWRKEYYVTYKILNYVSKTIKYKSRYSGKALTPTETLALREGVCLEFANLAVSMLQCAGVKSWVNIGYHIKNHNEWHAWIGCEFQRSFDSIKKQTRDYEPQASVVLHQDNYYKVVKNTTQQNDLGSYRAFWGYDSQYVWRMVDKWTQVNKDDENQLQSKASNFIATCHQY